MNFESGGEKEREREKKKKEEEEGEGEEEEEKGERKGKKRKERKYIWESQAIFCSSELQETPLGQRTGIYGKLRLERPIGFEASSFISTLIPGRGGIPDLATFLCVYKNLGLLEGQLGP
jgi:hypothetical protein